MTRYTRQDVLRILHLEPRHLQAWERAGLIPALSTGELYTFAHLSRFRALRELRSRRISAKSIRAQVDAMQKVAGMRNVLGETSAVRCGARLVFRHGGALVDPLTQQLAFDFALTHGRPLAVVGSGAGRLARAEHDAVRLLDLQIQELFVRAVQLEEQPGTLPEAIAVYEEILAERPDHAPASINLGTIFYNRRDFPRAETMYRRATVADPEYALAFFDLGNVLDEMLRLDEAVEAYGRAIALVPTYADAHYNLALAHERCGERRKALRHWMTYVRLDPVGPWAAHARGQARKILGMERLRIVAKAGRKITG